MYVCIEASAGNYRGRSCNLSSAIILELIIRKKNAETRKAFIFRKEAS
jgi:hypothetical protein